MNFISYTSSAALVVALASNPAMSANCYRGINISGAEFGKPGGVIDRDYNYPSDTTLGYFSAKGFDTIRLAFLWERLQPVLMGPLDDAELDRIRRTVALARSHRLAVILDPHNYARYRDQPVGSDAVPDAAFADFWQRLAAVFANHEDIVFGLMNEPHGIDSDQWLGSANAAIGAIRNGARAGNLVLVPGTAWTGAHSWLKPVDGRANGEALKGVVDPGNHFAIEVHQYFDDDFSGTKGNCSRAEDAVKAVNDFGDWLRQNNYRGFLGEFGVPASENCAGSLEDMVTAVEDNRDVWVGWSYWVGGDWWPESEELNIQPTPSGDRPQLQGLEPALAKRDAAIDGCQPTR